MIAAAVVLLAVSGSHALSITGVGGYNPAGMPAGLSGITYAGGNQYYAVDDSGGLMNPVVINMNTTGGITSAGFGVTVPLSGTDLEGVAFRAAGNNGQGSVFVSDETGPAIQEYSLAGAYLSSVTVPTIYGQIRSNYSLESLTMRADGNVMWTANEEALSVDGSLSTSRYGTVVRLQKFQRTGGNWLPGGQFAYRTLDWGSSSPFTDQERSGVSDLCVLPNGQLLVLERRLGGFIPEFDNHIFVVDTAGATDVSNIAALDGASYTPVSKTTLWSGNFSQDYNYEGLCLGPQLSPDTWGMLMISDGDGDPGESLYSLRLSGNIIPEPSVLSLLSSGLIGLLGMFGIYGLGFCRRRFRMKADQGSDSSYAL